MHEMRHVTLETPTCVAAWHVHRWRWIPFFENKEVSLGKVAIVVPHLEGLSPRQNRLELTRIRLQVVRSCGHLEAPFFSGRSNQRLMRVQEFMHDLIVASVG